MSWKIMPLKNSFPVFCLMIAIAFCLTACATGSGYSGWVPTASGQRAAEKAPSQLIVGNRKNNGSDDLFLEIFPVGEGPNSEGSDSGQNGSFSYQDGQVTPPGLEQVKVMPEYNGPTIKIGLLLPLSGEKKDLGQSMLNAAQMAMFDAGGAGFELLPRDTRGTPAGAREAAQSAAENGASLILGPLFAGSVKAAKPVVSRYSLNMIAFSTDWNLADNNTFIMGFLPFAQVQRISEYAARNNITRVGILAPNDLYGNVVTKTFREYARMKNIEIVDTVHYNPLQKDLSPAIRTFTDYDRRVRLLDYHKETLQKSIAANPADEQLALQMAELEKLSSYGDVPFDAVFMPMGGDQAIVLANLLSYYDLGPDEVIRLGTGLWDDASLAREPHMNGALYAAPPTKMRADFEKRYRQLYGESSPRLSSLAYDATALAAVLVSRSSEEGKQIFNRRVITNPNGYAGIDGIFRFRPDGLIERGLSVLKYEKGKIKEADLAPSTFEIDGS